MSKYARPISEACRFTMMPKIQPSTKQLLSLQAGINKLSSSRDMSIRGKRIKYLWKSGYTKIALDLIPYTRIS